MKRNPKFSLSILFLLTGYFSFAQEYNTGLTFDDARYNSTPLKAILVQKDYEGVPTKYSLKQFAPNPGDQGDYGTCVGWSTAYAARTIVEAQQNRLQDKYEITETAFSASFIYDFIKDEYDTDCIYGSFIDDALDVMSQKGVPLYNSFDIDCATEIPDDILEEAKKNRIQGYSRLFDDSYSNVFKVEVMKKALSQGNPVVIGMKVPGSFYYAEDVWEPYEEPDGFYGGHAMCVIGYDNNRFEDEGAFEVMNSWGNDWGNDGFIWIRYSDFTDFTKYAYEMIAIPKADENVADLSGEITFVQNTGTPMLSSFIENSRGIAFYEMNDAYKSGTEFRIYITNNQPAFVYAFGTDRSEEVFPIFPYKKGMSPALTYKNNSIAIPDEDYYIEMDEQSGTDYMCVLYTKEPIDFDGLIKSLDKQKNVSFTEKIHNVLGQDIALPLNAEYDKYNMKFSAISGDRKIVAMVVAIEHIN